MKILLERALDFGKKREKYSSCLCGALALISLSLGGIEVECSTFEGLFVQKLVTHGRFFFTGLLSFDSDIHSHHSWIELPLSVGLWARCW